MPAKYVLKKVAGGKFRFALHSRTGQPIITSPTYETKVAAKNAIKTLQRNVNAEVDDQTVAANGKAAAAGTRGGTAKSAATAVKRSARKAADAVEGTAKRATTGTTRKSAATDGAATRPTAKRAATRKSTEAATPAAPVKRATRKTVVVEAPAKRATKRTTRGRAGKSTAAGS